MKTDFPSLAELQNLIGKKVVFHNHAYAIVEVLEDEPAIVIRADSLETSIQPDQHGFARKQIRELRTIPVLNQEKTELHPEFLEILF